MLCGTIRDTTAEDHDEAETLQQPGVLSDSLLANAGLPAKRGSSVAVMSKDEKRFVVDFEQKSFSEVTRILRDTETGVCYLFQWSGTGGGLTALLNADGTPVVKIS